MVSNQLGFGKTSTFYYHFVCLSNREDANISIPLSLLAPFSPPTVSTPLSLLAPFSPPTVSTLSLCYS